MGYNAAMRYAAIDIGTVTCRLLVAEVDAGGIHEICRRSEITNLGAGVDATGALSGDAIERVCAQVAEYKDIIDAITAEGEPVQVHAMATSASRDASNAAEFQERMAALGVDLSVIPGKREAELSFLGAAMDFPGERLLVSDIGGGSTELIAGVAGKGIVHAHSLNIGARRATERLLHADPPTKAERAALAAWVQEEFAPFFAALEEVGFQPQRYVAVAGTSTTAVSIRDEMDPYDAQAVHGSTVSAEELGAVAAKVNALPLKARKQVVGLQPSRAPIIVAGFIILQQILTLSGLPSFTASETDILEGIILDAAMHKTTPACGAKD